MYIHNIHCIYTNLHACTHTEIDPQICTHYVHMYIRAHACMYTHSEVCVCVHACLHACVHVCVLGQVFIQMKCLSNLGWLDSPIC